MPVWPREFETALRQNLPHLTTASILSPADRLIDLGLDSMATVALVIDIEDACGVELPDEVLVPDTFDTAASLWAAVSSCAAG